jgi:hypothetical protein
MKTSSSMIRQNLLSGYRVTDRINFLKNSSGISDSDTLPLFSEVASNTTQKAIL